MRLKWAMLNQEERDAAVRVLTARQLEVLKALDRMSQRQLAKALGVARSVVREHQERAEEKLAKELRR